jgi:hypothetical protein
MTVLVAAETVLLILMAVVVVALLRSHAEILRRLDSLAGGGAAGADGLATPESGPRREGAVAAPDIAGSDLDGMGVQVGMAAGAPSTLVAFLTSGCMTCMEFWRSFSERAPEIPDGGRLVIVVKDSAHESPAKLRRLAPAGIPVVMSTATWERYEVPAAPYFVWVDGASGEIHGEGAASAWDQVSSLLADALADAEDVEWGPSGPERSARIDDELARAGIGPGHPSLYPHGEAGMTEPER